MEEEGRSESRREAGVLGIAATLVDEEPARKTPLSKDRRWWRREEVAVLRARATEDRV